VIAAWSGAPIVRKQLTSPQMSPLKQAMSFTDTGPATEAEGAQNHARGGPGTEVGDTHLTNRDGS
jgi:hypothetical protein